MVLSDLPFERSRLIHSRYNLLRRPESAPIPREEEQKNQQSKEYAAFLKDQERKVGPDGFLDSNKYSHTFYVKKDRERYRSLSETPRPSVVKTSVQYDLDKKDHDKKMKVIEDHMWQHKQEERELKRVEGDIIKNQRSVRHVLRDYENVINKKRMAEEKKLNTGLEKYTVLRRDHVHQTHQLTKSRIMQNYSHEHELKDRGRKVAMKKSDLSRQYRAKMSEMELKQIEVMRLNQDFETKLRTKEQEQYKLKQELAELAIALNMEAQKGRQQSFESTRDKKRETTSRIVEDLNAKQTVDNKIAKSDGDTKQAEMTKRKLSADLAVTKSHIAIKQRDEQRHLADTQMKLADNTDVQRHLNEAALHAEMDLKTKQMQANIEAITQLSSAVKKQDQELTKVKGDYEEAVEKMRGLQAALDNSYKEMAELHRNNAAQDSKVQEIALSAEMQVREELKLQIEKQQQQNKWEKETLGMQIEDLQMTMTRMEKDHSRREDLLRQEIADLQKQLQEDEARTQELTQGVSLATRPLLRQIENLQATFNAQSATWEKVEKNLSDRLAETQNQLAVITEKERNANEQLLEISTKVSSLEAQNSRLRQEKSQLTAQLEMLKSKVEMSEDAKQHEAAQLELMRQQMQQEINDIRKEKVLLETQLEVEKSKMEQEKKKSGMFQEQIRDLERDLQRSRSRGTPVRTTPSPVSVSRQDSLVGSLHEQSFQSITQEELDRSFILSSPNGNKQSLYEALRQSGAANLLENLQSQLKLRDGEINHLQGEIRSLERTRESMAKELVDLSNKNDDLEDKVKDLPVLLGQHQELDQRYNALLQMYGEKVEEANELRMDLADVKDMYKAQITQLLGQS